MWSFVAYFVSGVAFRRRILSFWQTSFRLLRLPVVYWDWVWFCISAEIAVVLYLSGYWMLIWGLALTCLQNVQPGRLILGDIAVWLCALFGRFRRTPWIRLMWIGFRCRWPHNLQHRTAQTVHVEPNSWPRSRFSASENLRPFRVTIHNNYVVEIFQGTRKIHINPRPKLFCFWPRLEGSRECFCN